MCSRHHSLATFMQKHVGRTGLMNVAMQCWSGQLHLTIPPNQNKTLVVSNMNIIAHNSLCSSRAYHLCIDLALIALLGNVACNFKKIHTITQDLSRRCIATRHESVSTYPRRPKAEAFRNVVDVVKRLHDPTDPSTARTASPCSAHVQLDDVQ